MSTHPASNRLLVATWLVFGIGLSLLATYLGRIYSLPIAGGQSYALLPRPAVLIWNQDHLVEPDFIHQLDLSNGRIARVPYSRHLPFAARNSRGQRITLSKRLEIIDEASGRRLWSGPPPGADFQLLGDHYLIRALDDKFQVIDLDKLLELGPQVTGQVPFEYKKTDFVVAGVSVNPPSSFYALHPIEGSNRFLYHFQNAKSSRVSVYELENGQLRTLASWPTTFDSIIHQYNGTIMTAAATGPEVEVRALSDFQLIKTMPFPKGLQGWVGAGTVAGSVASRNDIFSFGDAKTGETRVHRFDDFSLIPELDLTVIGGGTKGEHFDDRRYHLLGDNAQNSRRFVVYDALERRIVVERAPPTAWQAVKIVGGHLVFVNEFMAVTVERIDLKTGQTANVYQPFGWVAWALPTILLLALGWLMVWLRLTAHWSRVCTINIVLIVGLFVTPQLAHMAMLDSWRLLPRPGLGYLCTVMLALTFCLSVYVVFGRQRVLIRTAPVWLGLAALLGLCNLYVGEDGKRGLEGLPRVVSEFYRLLIEFSFVSLVVLLCMRLMGFRLSNSSPQSYQPQDGPAISMSDIFLFTGCIAAFVAAAAPNRAFLLAPMPVLGVAIGSMLISAPALLGLIALAPSPSIYRFMRTIAIILALLLIAEITAHLVLGQLHRQIWYSVLVVMRYLTFLFLATFTVGIVLRNAGYRWAKSAVAVFGRR